MGSTYEIGLFDKAIQMFLVKLYSRVFFKGFKGVFIHSRKLGKYVM